MRITSGGNVGIGTTSPTAVAGFTGLTIDNSSSGSLLDLNNSGTNNLRFLTLSSVDQRILAAGNLAFYTASSQRMQITSGGNVGIGTSSPTNYGLSGKFLDLNGGSTYAFYVASTTSTQGFFAMNEASALGALFMYTNHPLTFGTNNTERMRILSTGELQFTSIASSPTTNNVIYNSGTNLVLQGGGGSLLFYAGGSRNNGIVIRESNNDIYFTTNNTGTKMTIASSGNVLIGTADLGYKLSVNGDVLATAFYESSDIRFKNVLETNPIIDVDGIEVIKFNRKDNASIRYGYSAQQVQEFVPDAVSGENELVVNYSDVHTLKIAALERRIIELENKLK
jgi:uncharacterized protein YaiE (UPF0345 family)